MTEPPAQGLARRTPQALARVDVREDVRLRLQTTRQRRGAMAVLIAGILTVVTVVTGASPAFMGLLGAGVGLGSLQVRHAGRRLLLRWVAELGDSGRRDRALEQLARLATTTPLVVTSVRVEAAGHVALARLERGDFDGAVDVINAASRDAADVERQRLPTQGFLGEAVRALLGRLSPGAVPGIVRASAIVSDQASAEGPHVDFEPVLLGVRLLEDLAEGADHSLRRGWDELGHHPRAARHPAMVAAVGAVAADHHARPGPMRDEVLDRLGALGEGPRAMVLRLAPSLAEGGRAGYREPASAGEDAVALVPAPLRSLRPSPAPSRWLPALPRRSRRVFGFLVGTYGFASVLSLVAGDPTNILFLGFLAVAFLPSVVAAPVHRRRRREQLEAAGVIEGPDDPRWPELRVMPARGGAAKTDAASLHPFDAVELRVIVGLSRAEQALARGEVEAARGWMSWWFDTTLERGLDGISPVAIGASALRVAALTGRDAEAAERDRLLTPRDQDPRIVETNFARSGHGDTAAALGLARAVRLARAGDWAGASSQLMRADGDGPLPLDPNERFVYLALLRAIRRHGNAVPDALARQLETDAPANVPDLF